MLTLICLYKHDHGIKLTDRFSPKQNESWKNKVLDLSIFSFRFSKFSLKGLGKWQDSRQHLRMTAIQTICQRQMDFTHYFHPRGLFSCDSSHLQTPITVTLQAKSSSRSNFPSRLFCLFVFHMLGGSFLRLEFSDIYIIISFH